VAVGARPVLVAYNLFVAGGSLEVARLVAAEIRGPAVRALGLDVGGIPQVSCNLIDPDRTGPEAVYDDVRARLATRGASVARAELVGLIPARVLAATTPTRRGELDLAEDRTIEARLELHTRDARR
jgi:glutamate formiminotransferase